MEWYCCYLGCLTGKWVLTMTYLLIISRNHLLLRGMPAALGKPNSLGQVPREDFPGVFPQVLLEDGGQGNHGLTSAELGALHHALLVVHKEVSTAGQDCSSFVHVGLGGTLSLEVGHKPVNQLAQIPDVGNKNEFKSAEGGTGVKRGNNAYNEMPCLVTPASFSSWASPALSYLHIPSTKLTQSHSLNLLCSGVLVAASNLFSSHT